MPEHPDTMIWVAGVKPALVVKMTLHVLEVEKRLQGESNQ